MKKSNLIQIVTILLVSAMVMLFSTTVNAANDNNEVHDLTGTLTKNSTSNNTSSNNTNSNTNTSNTNKSNNTNNSSVYNNTNNNLPKTGIEDSIPVAALVVVFGVSAVYAYKKIKEYKNIYVCYICFDLTINLLEFRLLHVIRVNSFELYSNSNTGDKSEGTTS